MKYGEHNAPHCSPGFGAKRALVSKHVENSQTCTSAAFHTPYTSMMGAGRSMRGGGGPPFIPGRLSTRLCFGNS